jgi:DNA replication protein DnaC
MNSFVPADSARPLGRGLRAPRVLVVDDEADLLELLDDRVGSRATLITSQLPVTAWHAWLDEPTLADAILDRIVHGSHKIALKGESMRKLTKAT